MKACSEKRMEWILKTHEQLESVQTAQGRAMHEAQKLWEMMSNQITALEEEVAGLKVDIGVHEHMAVIHRNKINELKKELRGNGKDLA